MANESKTFISYSQQATPPYILLEMFVQFVAVNSKIWWNNKGSSFFSETRCYDTVYF